MKQSQANSPATSKLTDLSISSVNASSLLKPPPLSRSSSNRSISVDGKAYDRAHLCDEVLAAHFSAASQGLRLEAIEEKASKADQEMSKAKAELAATEAQEAMQCVMWKNMFEAEINSAKIYREKAEHAEVRWKSSKTEASQAKTEQLEVDRLRAEVVDRGAGWATERERLLDEIYELQASLASHEGRVAGFELQVQKSSEAAAQATVMRCNELEALAMVRQEAGQASLRAEATESKRATTEQQRMEATALAEAMKIELEMARKNEETSVALALAEARSEAVIAREAKTQIAELQIEVSENETLARVQALENERRKDAEEATRMHADAQQALELLCSFMQQRESENNSSKESDMCAIREFEARILAQSEAAASKEASAVAEAKTEATVATAAQKHCDELRAELVAQGRAQRDLHNELQALSNAAAAVRAVAAAKDDTIAELQATSKLMVSELALSGNSPAVHHRKVLDGKNMALELSRNSGTSGASGSTVGDGSLVTPPSVTPSDALSQASTQTLGATVPATGQGSGLYRSAANAQEGPVLPSWERNANSLERERRTTSLVDRVRSGSPQRGSPQPKAAEARIPAVGQRTPMRFLPAPVSSPSRPPSFVPPNHEETVNPQLSQAAAFLNAAAAKAAAAASAVEAFFPFVPSTTATTTTSNQDESTPKGSTTSGGSDAPLGGASSTGSKVTSSRQADWTDTGRFSQTTQDSGLKSPQQKNRVVKSETNQSPDKNADGKSWEEAQAVMTEQIRKDISLLRKALSDSGMRGSPLEDEVQALERQTLQQPKDVDTSPAASRSSTLEKRIPPAIKDMNSRNVRRLSPSQSTSNSGSLKVSSFANNPLSKNVGLGGSLRAQRTSPERQASGVSPLPREGVHLAVSEVVVGSGSHSFAVRSPSVENSGARSPDVPRASVMRMPPGEVRTQSATSQKRDAGKLMSSSSEVSLRRETSPNSLMASASEVSRGSHRTQVKASNVAGTVGPPRGVCTDVQTAPGGVPPGRFSGARSGSPPQNRPPPWLPSRGHSPTPPGVSRMVSVPARCKSPLSASVTRM